MHTTSCDENKPGLQAAGADPFQCNSTWGQNPPIQQIGCNFWTTDAVFISRKFVNVLNLCNIVYFMTASTISETAVCPWLKSPVQEDVVPLPRVQGVVHAVVDAVQTSHSWPPHSWEGAGAGGEISQNIYRLSRVDTKKVVCYFLMFYLKWLNVMKDTRKR